MAAKDLQAWARIGAATRLAQLEQERASILAAFPGMRRRGARISTGSGSRPKRKFSEEAKRRMSAGMVAYWRKRKAQEKK
jgi:hypothetical protein